VATSRKKWKLTYPGTDNTDKFPSERKAYEFLHALAHNYFADPTSMDPHATVWVTDGTDMNGELRWQRFEDIDLTEWSHLASTATTGEEA
jgi:hypothetical protein